jgi:predicted nucleic acid-binding Zn ribbon protein
MKQASRLLANLDNLRLSCDAGDLVCAAWKQAVGKKVAEHTRASKLVRDKLVVEVEDWMWQRNLMGLSRQILANLEKAVGPGIVADVEFRIMPPRRGPQAAQASIAAFELTDEASGIADPGLRRIYRAKRQREIA